MSMIGNVYKREDWLNDNAMENWNNRRQFCPSATSSVKNSTWAGLALNLSLRGNRPAAKRLKRSVFKMKKNGSMKAFSSPQHFISSCCNMSIQQRHIRVAIPFKLRFSQKSSELFQWIFFNVALQPNAGYGLLIHEIFEITHTTRHSR
jgi:hypothetical protein